MYFNTFVYYSFIYMSSRLSSTNLIFLHLSISFCNIYVCKDIVNFPLLNNKIWYSHSYTYSWTILWSKIKSLEKEPDILKYYFNIFSLWFKLCLVYVVSFFPSIEELISSEYQYSIHYNIFLCSWWTWALFLGLCVCASIYANPCVLPSCT